LITAAFGGQPGAIITEIPDNPRSRWLAAVALGGQGWYAAAATLLRELIADPDHVVASLAASTLASHRRQLGGHAAARALDALALRRLATRPDAAEARSDALLGLAADALGVGRQTEARRLITLAGQLDAGWRAEIRLGWVSAEVELGADRADLAVPHAERASERANASGSTRHRIKSALVLGAALAADGDHGRAIRLLAGTGAEASDLGLLPLLWPCALLLAELEPSRRPAHRRTAGDALHRVLRRADPAGRRIAHSSPWVPDPAGLTG
jgi:hypothetical protein